MHHYELGVYSKSCSDFLQIENRMLYYASAIGTEPLFSEIIIDQVTAFDREHLQTAL